MTLIILLSSESLWGSMGFYGGTMGFYGVKRRTPLTPNIAMIEYEEFLLCDSISLGYCLMGVKFSGKIVFGLSLALNTQLQFRKNIGT